MQSISQRQRKYYFSQSRERLTRYGIKMRYSAQKKFNQKKSMAEIQDIFSQSMNQRQMDNIKKLQENKELPLIKLIKNLAESLPESSQQKKIKIKPKGQLIQTMKWKYKPQEVRIRETTTNLLKKRLYINKREQFTFRKSVNYHYESKAKKLFLNSISHKQFAQFLAKEREKYLTRSIKTKKQRLFELHERKIKF